MYDLIFSDHLYRLLLRDLATIILVESASKEYSPPILAKVSIKTKRDKLSQRGKSIYGPQRNY